MEFEIIQLDQKRVAQTVVAISAEVANVVETVQRISKMTADLENTLVVMQLELEELYIALNKRSAVCDGEGKA